MKDRKIICFLAIVCIIPSAIATNLNRNSFLLKSVNHTKSIGEKHKSKEINHADLKCKYKCITTSELAPKFVGTVQARFIDLRTNDTKKNDQMEAPAAKFSIFNLLSDNEEGEDDQNNFSDDDESVKDEDSEEDFSFFTSEDEISTDKPEGTKEESFLKQYHRQTLRMHHWVLPLLLVYKLKFFMVIPLLLGSLVLLVGTTAIAGFFFALFAAALGIHVKTYGH